MLVTMPSTHEHSIKDALAFGFLANTDNIHSTDITKSVYWKMLGEELHFQHKNIS